MAGPVGEHDRSQEQAKIRVGEPEVEVEHYVDIVDEVVGVENAGGDTEEVVGGAGHAA